MLHAAGLESFTSHEVAVCSAESLGLDTSAVPSRPLRGYVKKSGRPLAATDDGTPRERATGGRALGYGWQAVRDHYESDLGPTDQP